MKTPIGFALKKECKYLQPVGSKIPEIDSLIDWKYFRTIFKRTTFIHSHPGHSQVDKLLQNKANKERS